jgi:transcription factor TFIIIB component B''
MLGTDFSVIEQHFPGRSRNDLKNKFKKEEKLRPEYVDKMLSERKPYDPNQFLDDVNGKFVFLLLHCNVFIIKLKFSNNRRFERRRKRKPEELLKDNSKSTKTTAKNKSTKSRVSTRGQKTATGSRSGRKKAQPIDSDDRDAAEQGNISKNGNPAAPNSNNPLDN